MEKFKIEYSPGKRHKRGYLVLGILHILLGGAALIVAFKYNPRPLVLLVISLYLGLGFVFLSGVLNKLRKYVVIDDYSMAFKNATAKYPTRIHWNGVKSITLYPSMVVFTGAKGNREINLGFMRFKDVRKIKKQIEKIADQKGIPYIRYNTINRQERKISKNREQMPGL
ncbi:MAG: hypothetical protein RR202_07645 [Bacteroidales bacterium]